MNNFIFGLPFFKTKINPFLYDKSYFVNTIMYNYNLDPERNQWDKHQIRSSNLHHQFNDRDNSNFKKINFNFLTDIYNKEIKNFLDFFDFNGKFDLSVANYTCMNNSNQHMRLHNHMPAHFSCVHYIKFNKNIHFPTVYKNPLDPFRFLNNHYLTLEENSNNLFKNNNEFASTKTSFMKDYFALEVEEDDFVVTPSFLEHEVTSSKQKNIDFRITIISNVILNN